MAAMKLLDVFLLPEQDIIGKKIEFTVKSMTMVEKTGDAIVTFEELPSLLIRIGSKVEARKLDRRRKSF